MNGLGVSLSWCDCDETEFPTEVPPVVPNVIAFTIAPNVSALDDSRTTDDD